MFVATFYALCVLCALLYYYTRTKSFVKYDRSFGTFQWTYLIGYLLATGGDWLQGPHVYALYDSYGLSKHDIELLFVAGFGSSVLFGTFIGSVADKVGRRNNCILYGVIYGAACITKHFSNFWILLVGRLFGGVATSILFSAFESWLVSEHNKRGFGSDLLSLIFTNATLGNSIVAVVAGVIAQFVADWFGYVAPFDASMLTLLAMCVFVVFAWAENYGDQKADISHSFKAGWQSLIKDREVLYLGLVQSLFEGSMYTFVLEWTPALTPSPTKSQANETSVESSTTIPHGYIFATFMVAIMIGSSFFRLLSARFRPEAFMRFVLLISSLSLLPTLVCPRFYPLVYIGFICFEICVGIFWPAMGFLRGIYVPEEARSTVMNFFRVPLNLIVIGILIQNLPLMTIFSCCVAFLMLATLAQCTLYQTCKAKFLRSHKTSSADATSTSASS